MIEINRELNNRKFEEIPEIKKYFMRIFTVLSKEVREKLNNLDVTKDKRKELKLELAFLSNEHQIKYLEELSDIYGQKL